MKKVLKLVTPVFMAVLFSGCSPEAMDSFGKLVNDLNAIASTYEQQKAQEEQEKLSALTALKSTASICRATEAADEYLYADARNPNSCYRNNEWHGLWEEHHSDGTVWSGFYVDGAEQGQWQWREPDGDVGIGPFVNGKRHGQWETREANGVAKECRIYRDGERVSARNGGC